MDWPGGLSLAVTPRVTLPELPYLAGSVGLWAGLWSAGVGVPEEDARGWLEGGRAPKAEGWGSGVGIGGGLRPPARTHSTARGKQTLSAESLPFQEEGGDGKVTSPFLLKKSKGSPWAALQPPSPHSWTMHPCIFLLGHGRGLDFLS